MQITVEIYTSYPVVTGTSPHCPVPQYVKKAVTIVLFPEGRELTNFLLQW
jgi:hypothetical protein